jgi:hypothetical protein
VTTTVGHFVGFMLPSMQSAHEFAGAGGKNWTFLKVTASGEQEHAEVPDAPAQFAPNAGTFSRNARQPENPAQGVKVGSYVQKNWTASSQVVVLTPTYSQRGDVNM